MIAQRDPWTQEERDFLLAFADDTEESPWMVTTDMQRQAINAFLNPLEHYASTHHPDWYISSDLAVLFPKPEGKTGQVAPDVLVAWAPKRLRDSFDTVAEGGFPAFVLEVVSPDYSKRDEQEKARIYGMYGVEEYAIFNPKAKRKPKLQGYHRVAGGAWTPWPLGAQGELRSEVLGVTLVTDGSYLRLQDAEGHWILSKAEEAEQRAAEEAAARAAAEQRAEVAEAARAAAEQRADAAAAQRKDLEVLLADTRAALARLP
jgi:Uma2 family endonuclease